MPETVTCHACGQPCRGGVIHNPFTGEPLCADGEPCVRSLRGAHRLASQPRARGPLINPMPDTSAWLDEVEARAQAHDRTTSSDALAMAAALRDVLAATAAADARDAGDARHGLVFTREIRAAITHDLLIGDEHDDLA